MITDGIYRVKMRHHVRLAAVLGATSLAPVLLIGGQAISGGPGNLGEHATWTLAFGVCLLIASFAAASAWTEIVGDPEVGDVRMRVGFGPFILDGASVPVDACEVVRLEEVAADGRLSWALSVVGFRTSVDLYEDHDPTRAHRIARGLAATVGLPLEIVEPGRPPERIDQPVS